MSFLKKIFGKKETPIKTYPDFWKWFQENEKKFFKVVKEENNIEANFFDQIAPKLAELKDGYFFLTGMCDDNTVELILTADGNIRNIAFVEELVEQAPYLKGWKFTALKPALDIEDVGIEMEGYKFNSGNLSFYPNDIPNFPDEIDLTVVHHDLNDKNKNTLINGTYIFLDNFLGELDFANHIDNLKIIGKNEAEKELIPISKLKAFLIWRQKEFIEKYDGIRYDTEDDTYSLLEAGSESGNKLLATINTQLLEWDCKASHPWIALITFKYDGVNGMPDNDDYEKLNEIEENILAQLSDSDGYLYIGRQTADNEREIFFACKDFRKPSKVFFKIQQDNEAYNVTYEIYKDKYWQSFERFRVG